MRVTITIDCDNAAFEPYPEQEVGRILVDVGNRLKGFADSLGLSHNSPLYDANGNKVGQMKVTGREK